MYRMRQILPALLFFFALPALAAGLSSDQVESFKQARDAGHLKEGADGYLHPTSGDASLRQLADQVNNQRKKRYEQLAQQEKVPLSVVEQTAGKKLRGM
ncbi:MAG: DUF1318 domain-containing protein [Magnetococcales bacterium]|nr:DUF1318 domain-containing protein [Magnetococcales bacterium]